MRERRVGIPELEGNLGACLEEVRSGTTLLVTEGGRGIARLIPGAGGQRVQERPGDRRTNRGRSSQRGGASC